jgi:glucosamine--fructose-6-phosphate aminotransferase (isomerizing)
MAWIACLMTQDLIEQYGRIRIEAEYASEFRHENSHLDNSALISVIGQPGQTSIPC